MAVERQVAFRVGDWIVDPETNALSRDDVERHVEPKVMQVLLTLAMRHNQVISKDELIRAVWPDTFVSDDALTRCISILRRVTEDDPQAPRFIQTVPKRGYRLIAPVSDLPEPPLVPRPREPAPAPQPGTSTLSPSHDPLGGEVPQVVPRFAPSMEPANSAKPAAFAELAPFAANPRNLPDHLTARRASRPLGWSVAAALLLLLLLGGVLLYRFGGNERKPAPAGFYTVPFTTGAGEQTEATFSPDGRTLAFVRTSEDGLSRRICLKRLGSESVTELIPEHHDSEQQFSPAWSPDGRQIAYLASSNAGLGLFVTASDGSSPAERVFIPQEPSHWEQGALSWSPDGKYLIFPDHPGTSASSSVFRLALDTRKLEQITSPPAGWEGDLTPAYSPDGKNIAFTRASENAVRDLYWVSLADGSLHQLTQDRRDINSLAWRQDSRTIVFSSNRGGKYSLWQIALDGSQPERLPVGTDDAFGPAVGPEPGELAYSQGTALWSIDRIQGQGAATAVQSVFASTEQDSAPSLAPGGRAFAFQSQRSGSQEIWVASINEDGLRNGDGLRQLTFRNGPITGSPAWSHHGDRILFDSRPDGHSHIFSVPASGGDPVQITFGNVNDIVPRWSANDRSILFRSNRGGRWQIWRVGASGGAPQPVTSGDGIAAQESADGKLLFYTRGGEAGLWSVPTAGGEETKLLAQPAEGFWGYFQVLPEGILYLDVGRSRSSIRLYNPATRQNVLVAPLERKPPAYQGLSATQNGKLILLTGERDAGQHITLVQSR